MYSDPGNMLQKNHVDQSKHQYEKIKTDVRKKEAKVTQQINKQAKKYSYKYTSLPMSKVTFLPERAVTSGFPLTAKLCLPICRLHISSERIQTRIHRTEIRTEVRTKIRTTSMLHWRPCSSNAYCKALPRPRWIIPKLLWIFMKKIAPVPIWTFFTIIELLAQLHLMNYPLVLIPNLCPPFFFTATNINKFLPVGWRLAHIFHTMGKVAVLTIPALTQFKFSTYPGLEENIACPSTGWSIWWMYPWIHGWVRWWIWHLAFRISSPLVRRVFKMWMHLIFFIVHWELRPGTNVIIPNRKRMQWWRNQSTGIRKTHICEF